MTKLRGAGIRLRRSIAQRGLRVALLNLVRQVRQGKLTAAVSQAGHVDVAHAFDLATGMDTGGIVHGSALVTGHPHDVYNVAYYGTEPSIFRGVLDCWRETPSTKALEEYTFIDFGSGKGRVVLLASEHPFQRCVGVELNPGLHRVAMENIHQWQKLGKAVSQAEVLCQDATEFVFPETPCVVYLFNPFAGKVLRKLLEHIATVFADRPGELDLLYVNGEFVQELEQFPGFKKMWAKPIRMSMDDVASGTDGLAKSGGSGQEPCSGWRWMGVAEA